MTEEILLEVCCSTCGKFLARVRPGLQVYCRKPCKKWSKAVAVVSTGGVQPGGEPPSPVKT